MWWVAGPHLIGPALHNRSALARSHVADHLVALIGPPTDSVVGQSPSSVERAGPARPGPACAWGVGVRGGARSVLGRTLSRLGGGRRQSCGAALGGLGWARWKGGSLGPVGVFTDGGER